MVTNKYVVAIYIWLITILLVLFVAGMVALGVYAIDQFDFVIKNNSLTTYAHIT